MQEKEQKEEKVASFAEAWIEILKNQNMLMKKCVASFAEAWIEILIREGFRTLSGSPPSRRRGLKLPDKL